MKTEEPPETVTGELDGISAMRQSVGLKDKPQEKIKTDHLPVDPKDDQPLSTIPNDQENPFELRLKEIKDKKEKEKEEEEKPPPKKKRATKTKAENIAALRARKDELQARVEELEADRSPVLKPLEGLLHRESGELALTEDSVTQFMTDYESMKERVEELQANLTKTEGSLRDISIKDSNEWKDGYEQPYIQARSVLAADLINLDTSGQPKNKEITEEFVLGLIGHVEQAGSVDMMAVKSSLKQFAHRYEEVTNEVYDPPSMRDLNASLNEVLRMRGKANTAFEKWEEDKAVRTSEANLKNQAADQEATAAGKRERFKEANEALNNFDFDEVEGVFEPSKITETFNSTFKGNEDVIENAANAPSYSEVLKLQAKGRLYDDLLEMYKESISKVKEVKQSKTNGKYGAALNHMVTGDRISSREEDEALKEMRQAAGFVD